MKSDILGILKKTEIDRVSELAPISWQDTRYGFRSPLLRDESYWEHMGYWVDSVVLEYCWSSKTAISKVYVRRYLAPKDFEYVVNAVSQACRLVCVNWSSYLFIGEKGHITIEAGGLNEDDSRHIEFTYIGAATQEWIDLAAYIDQHDAQPDTDTSIDENAYFLYNKPLAGMTLQSIGIAGVDFQRGNYTPYVCAAFDQIVKQFSSPSPLGRLAILTGRPGSGKTHFIRGLMKTVPNCIFVFLDPGMIGSIISANLLGVLLKVKEEEEKKIVLVLEDADAALLKRGAERETGLAALLNLTSGVVGELLNIYVIATTNAAYVEVDEALKRDMRAIGGETKIDELPQDQVVQVYRRLVNDEAAVYDGPPILGSIYLRAAEYLHA